MHDYQFGFQIGKSAGHVQVLHLYASIIKAIEKHKKACKIFLDFAKAFDAVNHDLLLRKLEHYGIWLRGELIEWFKSYLENRKLCVNINGNSSKCSDITHGVPQGSMGFPQCYCSPKQHLKLA